MSDRDRLRKAAETTLIVWWCEEHKSSGIYRLGNRVCWNGQFTKVLDVKDCRMVERALLAQQTGDTDAPVS